MVDVVLCVPAPFLPHLMPPPPSGTDTFVRNMYLTLSCLLGVRQEVVSASPCRRVPTTDDALHIALRSPCIVNNTNNIAFVDSNIKSNNSNINWNITINSNIRNNRNINSNTNIIISSKDSIFNSNVRINNINNNNSIIIIVTAATLDAAATFSIVATMKELLTAITETAATAQTPNKLHQLRVFSQ